MTTLLRISITLALIALGLTTIEARRRVDLSANLTCHWNADEVSGNLISDVNSTDCELTDVNTVGTGTIDSTAARDFELSNNEHFTNTGNATLATGGNDAAFTICARVKAETWPTVGTHASIINLTFQYALSWNSNLGGFQGRVWDEGFGTANPFASYPSPDGSTYNLCTGHDASGNVGWLRVNSDSRTTAAAYVDGTRSSATDDFFIGVGTDAVSDDFDGLIGPVSYWKRSISDGDMNEWVSCKGDYTCITGGGTVLCNRLLLGVGCEALSATWVQQQKRLILPVVFDQKRGS